MSLSVVKLQVLAPARSKLLYDISIRKRVPALSAAACVDTMFSASQYMRVVWNTANPSRRRVTACLPSAFSTVCAAARAFPETTTACMLSPGSRSSWSHPRSRARSTDLVAALAAGAALAGAPCLLEDEATSPAHKRPADVFVVVLTGGTSHARTPTAAYVCGRALTSMPWVQGHVEANPLRWRSYPSG